MSVVLKFFIMNFAIILAVFLVSGFTSATEQEGSVKLTVLYESYCPDSVRFVVNQLNATWKDLNQFIRLELVPFGFAVQWYKDGDFNFRCQHGFKECIGNILHACALYNACGPMGSLDCPVDNLTKAVEYISCIIDERNQWDSSEECATDAGLQHQHIKDCASSRLGRTLESGYGNVTTAFNTTTFIDYIPFILINGVHTKEIQEEAEHNLKSLICKNIPSRCESTTATPNTTLVE